MTTQYLFLTDALGDVTVPLHDTVTLTLTLTLITLKVTLLMVMQYFSTLLIFMRQYLCKMTQYFWIVALHYNTGHLDTAYHDNIVPLHDTIPLNVIQTAK